MQNQQWMMTQFPLDSACAQTWIYGRNKYVQGIIVEE
jgi:hypothetical protein